MLPVVAFSVEFLGDGLCKTVTENFGKTSEICVFNSGFANGCKSTDLGEIMENITCQDQVLLD